MIQRYVSKISGPLLDRIDIHIDGPAVRYKEMRGAASPEGSDHIRERVVQARERQLWRFKAAGEPIYANAQMSPRQIRACATSLQTASACWSAPWPSRD